MTGGAAPHDSRDTTSTAERGRDGGTSRDEAQGASEKCGHLSPGDERVRTEAIVHGRVAADRDAGRGDPVDHVFEPVSVVIEEVVDGGSGEIECSRQHRCHLPPGHLPVGTELIVHRGTATECDSGFGDAVDRALEHITVIVGEEILSAHSQLASASDEGSHLPSGDTCIGAVAVIGRRIAADGQACGRDCFDAALVRAPVIIDEAPTGWQDCQHHRQGQQREHASASVLFLRRYR